MNAKTLYTEAYNQSLESSLTPEGVAELGARDGRKDARNLIRQVAGRVDSEAALRDIRARYAHLFDGDKPAPKADHFDTVTV